uniref:Uncharacterized protein SAML0267 n=1 Tax=Streptomyces ambofaciens (strain ATCC 23877 / 3486 / DSM 40053 / JCM 4204 / NBRC 12836 / NRRL B-2516) TaxID=278992 RepID=Q1RR92_STRA7|nr:conserved hypothetical protein [Streptomyces ambofaciens ATCC 23877]CAJ89254.1 conserved hypothetical protein [Streptomyces ambofaciens ATCC 23877]
MCARCGQRFTEQRWEETTAHRTAWSAGGLSVCGSCHADVVAREEAAAGAARLQAAAPPGPERDHDHEDPGKVRGLFRRRGWPHTSTPSPAGRGGEVVSSSSGPGRAGAVGVEELFQGAGRDAGHRRQKTLVERTGRTAGV